jgi:hypothetical protein
MGLGGGGLGYDGLTFRSRSFSFPIYGYMSCMSWYVLSGRDIVDVS